MRIDLDGLVNARDLGGLPIVGGGFTQSRVIFRSDHPAMLTSRGWAQFREADIRTIISLETGGLSQEDSLRMNREIDIPAGIDVPVLHVPVEDASDSEFMNAWARTGLWGTPLYFADALKRWPVLYGNALKTIAYAKGPVLMHCGRGHDRTGLLSLLLLALAGVTTRAIAEDYLLSSRNLRVREERAVTSLESSLADAGTTAYAAIATAIAVIDDEYLEAAGLDHTDVAHLRQLLHIDRFAR